MLSIVSVGLRLEIIRGEHMESIVYNLSNRSEYISSGNSNSILVYSNKVTDDPEEQSIGHFRFL